MNQLITKEQNGDLTMTSREIAEVVGSRHDKVKQSIERLAYKKDANGNPAPVISLPPLGEYLDSLGRPATVYRVSKRDSYIVVAQLSPEFTAKLVDRWQELESKVATHEVAALPANYIQALEALVESEKQKQIAIATKAEIGSRREATAMSTASTATRRASKLERDLDRSKEYCTIKRMTMLTHGQTFNWRLLKSAAQDLGKPSLDIYDANYGTVKNYHRDVWMEAYGIEVAA